ncbi:SDR family oxidoreductase [Thiolinea disciformis]|uniref:SDR family oxidoreductase n=1 Tax=Thiolinea disciformis TaxID=125614 RepID=UPI000380F87D|nr:SDR family oxidoreductase [Thiolinea disciformis]
MTIEKIVLITGASRGIGAATALLAAQQGYTVCVNYLRNHAAAQKVVTTIHANGGKAFAIAADVAQETEVVRLFAELDHVGGRLAGLVNNAGILEKQMRVLDMDAARLNRILSTNITSAFLCAREAIKRMSTQRGGQGGAIVNVSSAASRLGSANEYVDYAASKGAIDTFTLGLAREIAQEGIRVNAVRPGLIATDIHASGGEATRIARLAPLVPMQRGGEAQEVAEAIVWLLSEKASYVTGSLLDISGGR